MLICFLFSIFFSFAQTDYTLPPIQIQGSDSRSSEDSSETVQTDFQKDLLRPVVKAKNYKEFQMPVLVSGTSAGSLIQIKGLGLSSEDTAVFFEGVSLNGAQGGGFDFSSFPSYLWSGQNFQSGAAFFNSDLRATAGAFHLIPWTKATIASEAKRVEALFFHSQQNLTQLAVRGSTGKSVFGISSAAVLGMSLGDSHGPSGGFSSALTQSDSFRSTFHLIATDLKNKTFGSNSYPTPHAFYLHKRFLPVLNNEWSFSKTQKFQFKLFSDYSEITSEDPDHFFTNKTLVKQWGLLTRYEVNQTHFEVFSKKVQFASYDFGDFAEWSGYAYVKHLFQFSDFQLDPSIKVSALERLGFHPEFSLGARYTPQLIFLRLTYSKRYPSLVDRYYRDPFFLPSPDLNSEDFYSAQTGIEFKKENWNGFIEFQEQYRPQAALTSTQANSTPPGALQVRPEGEVFIHNLNFQMQVLLDPKFSLFSKITLTNSEVSSRSQEVPYLPTYVQVVGVEKDFDFLKFQTLFRFSSDYASGFGSLKQAGYFVGDLSLQKNISDHFEFQVGIDNFLDREYQVVKDYDAPRRFGWLRMLIKI